MKIKITGIDYLKEELADSIEDEDVEKYHKFMQLLQESNGKDMTSFDEYVELLSQISYWSDGEYRIFNDGTEICLLDW